MTAAPVWILGAGGHAKVVVATARAAGLGNLAIADDDPSRHGSHLLGVPVSARLSDILGQSDAHAVLAIGDNATRHRLAARARCRFVSVIHPSAVVEPSARIAPGAMIFAGAVIQPDVQLGAHAIVNTGASIDHDCVLGSAVHVAPGARLAGNVTLEDGVFVGIGAVLVPGVTVAAWTRIGAGAAVVASLPGGVTAVGVPARPLPASD